MTGEQRSKSREIASLAEELVADIELTRLEGQELIFKAMRLARLHGSEFHYGWLRNEMYGYNPESKDPVTSHYYSTTGRDKHGSGIPFSEVCACLADRRARLEAMVETAKNKGTWTLPSAEKQQRDALQGVVESLEALRARILALLYDFVVAVHHETLFSGMAETIFERYKEAVDARLSQSCGDVLAKIPAAYDRLADGDPESISHALTTCRRMIDAFADDVFPPREEPYTIGEEVLPVGAEHTRNRIKAYIADRGASKGCQHRLNQTLRNLYKRVSKGVHSDVTPQEAQAVVLQTYLFLGEVITLAEPPSEDRVDTATKDDQVDGDT